MVIPVLWNNLDLVFILLYIFLIITLILILEFVYFKKSPLDKVFYIMYLLPTYWIYA